MLFGVILLLGFISVVQGTMVPEQSHSQTGQRDGKILDWQKFFDTVYFNKTFKPEPEVEVDDDYEGGNITITGNGGFFFNPPATEAVTRQEKPESIVFTATVVHADDVVQIKVDIRNMNFQGPVEGDCGNDSLTITGTNPGPEVPILCGVVTNQILYLDVDNTDDPILFTMSLKVKDTIHQTWNMSISFLKEAEAVPSRCLQYHTATTGIIESFNYGGDSPMMINDQTYSICFGYVVGYCDIVITFKRLDLGSADESCSYDYLLIGDDQCCGDKDDSLITAKADGPISIGVRSDSNNERQEEGFSATYTMLGC